MKNKKNTSTENKQKRIERLVWLAKVWGKVKFFHPFPAYQNIDWDRALIKTIPMINAAQNPAEFQTALDSMLAELNDKTTFAEIKTKTESESSLEKIPVEAVRLVDEILVLNLDLISKSLAENQTMRSKIDEQIKSLSAQAAAVIYDCRLAASFDHLEDGAAAYFFETFLRGNLSSVLTEDVLLATYRYRLHNGYAPQSGQTTGSYYSALVTDAPGTLSGSGTEKIPLGLILNERTPDISDLAGGLQSKNLAYIVQEGESTKESGANVIEMDLPDGVTVKMRTTELVNADGTLGFQSDLTISENSDQDFAIREMIALIKANKAAAPRNEKISANAPQRGLKEDPYKEMVFPNAEYRLLALFRFWTVIENFFPYKHLIGETWQDVLPRYISKFDANETVVDYQMTIREMVAEIRDSHGFIRGTNALNESLGMFTVPFAVRYIDDQAVVYYLVDDELPVNLGDVIISIDGEPEAQRRQYLSRLLAASTPQNLNSGAALWLLRGQKDSRAKIVLKDIDGNLREIEIDRTEMLNSPDIFKAFYRTTPVVEILPDDIAYVDLGRLQLGEVDEMFAKIKETKALIFDLRGYPNGTAWAIVPYLTNKSNVPGALFSRPICSGKNLIEADFTNGTNYSFVQQLPKGKDDIYGGKIVVLIDEWAMSQAEHSCLFFEAAADVTFIGMPTAGANGDISNMVLPGEIFVTFSGHEVRHADGRQLQRIGIEPMIKVSPTIRGIAQKNDEILEAAVKFLQSVKI